MKIEIPDEFLKNFIDMVSFGEVVPATAFHHGEEAYKYSQLTDQIFKSIAEEKPDLFIFDEDHEVLVPKCDDEIENIIEKYDSTRFLDILAHTLTDNYMLKTYSSEVLDNMPQDKYDEIFAKKISEYEEFIYDEGIAELSLDIDIE